MLGIRTSQPAEYWMRTHPRILATTLVVLEEQDKAVAKG